MPRKKQRRAWGSITEVQRGKRYVLRWPDPSKRCGRASLTVRGTYREACERLDVIHAEALAAPACAATTLGQVYERWMLPDIRARCEAGELGENTRRSYEGAWRNHAEPRWGDVAASDVKALDVQEWLDGLTRPTAAVSLGLLQQLTDIAVRYELAPSNKFREKYRLPSRAASRSRDVVDGAESDEILSALRGQVMEPAYIVMRFGGARVGEALGVMAGELLFESRGGAPFCLVPIHRRMDGSGVPVGKLKTRESYRTAIVPPPYSERLREIAAERSADGIEWLTAVSDGSPVGGGRANKLWKGACEKAVGRALPPMRNMRTSWRTSGELEWHIAPNTLELLMGHKLPGVSGQHYMRPDELMPCRDFMRQFAENGPT